MSKKIEMFSQQRIEFQKEVNKHPKLVEQISESGAVEFVDILAFTAAYCGIVVDGYYYPEELDRLCDILIQRLQHKRTIILLPESRGKIH